jgi:hypothetical protein
LAPTNIGIPPTNTPPIVELQTQKKKLQNKSRAQMNLTLKATTRLPSDFFSI